MTIKLQICLFAIHLAFATSATANSGLLMVSVDGPKSASCPLFVALYRDAKSWLSDEPFRYQIGSMKSGAGRVQFRDLPSGKYAIVAFCDQNGNGKLDETLLGIPKEPYGFSNGREGVHHMDFEEGSFAISQADTERRIRILLLRPL